MSKTLKTMGVMALAITMALPAQAQETPDVDTVVVTIGGTDVTLGHMMLAYSGLPDEYKQLPPQQLWDGILQQMIQQTALSQSDDAVETKRVRLAMDNERRALLASEVLSKALAEPVTEEDVQAAYDAEYGEFEGATEYNASHILVETEEEAMAVVAELGGGADFATVAREKSTGPSGPSGGTLGWFEAGMMVAPFQAAVEELEPQTISVPVQTQFGWHVIRLNDVRKSTAPGLEEVRGTLAENLQRERVQSQIFDITESANVVVNPDAVFDPSVLSQLQFLAD